MANGINTKEATTRVSTREARAETIITVSLGMMIGKIAAIAATMITKITIASTKITTIAVTIMTGVIITGTITIATTTATITTDNRAIVATIAIVSKMQQLALILLNGTLLEWWSYQSYSRTY